LASGFTRKLLFLIFVVAGVVVAQWVPKDDVYTVVKEVRGTKPTWIVIFSGHSASKHYPSSPRVRYTLQFDRCLDDDLKEFRCDPPPLRVGQSLDQFSPRTSLRQNSLVMSFTKTAVPFNGLKGGSYIYKIVRTEVEKDSSVWVEQFAAEDFKKSDEFFMSLGGRPVVPAQPAPKKDVHSFDPNAPYQSIPRQKDIPTIAKLADGSIVSIVMSDKNGKPIAQGSGFLVTNDGLIVTNYHVISEGSSAVAKLPDSAFYAVDGVLRFDKARDVAVIKAHGKNFRPLTLGDSDRVQVGEEVVAIGNPLSLESTVSNGIVSAVRTVADEGGKFLQITAPISPGSSGGPLFNMAGEVVGITTMYLKGGENLNFAIPINEARRLLEDSSTKLSPLPNEPERAESNTQTHPEQATPVKLPSGPRDYYQQLFDAGAFFSTGPNGSKLRNVDYACFNDDPAWEQFFTLVLRGGDRILEKTVYNKGVKFFTHEYHFDGTSYVLSIPPTDPKAYTRTSRTLQLSIEPTTMRYVEYTTVTTTVGWGETAATGTDPYGPWGGICEKVAGNALPPNMKMAAVSPDGSGTQEQQWEDIKYCYKNPANSLQLSDGKIASCGELNATIEAREKECKSKGPKTNPENCKGFLKSIKDLKAGRP
jgi:S1-C subfamily serine protease